MSEKSTNNIYCSQPSLFFSKCYFAKIEMIIQKMETNQLISTNISKLKAKEIIQSKEIKQLINLNGRRCILSISNSKFRNMKKASHHNICACIMVDLTQKIPRKQLKIVNQDLEVYRKVDGIFSLTVDHIWNH